MAFDPNYRWPYSIQINFGFQQQFGKALPSAPTMLVRSIARRRSTTTSTVRSSTSPQPAPAVQAARTRPRLAAMPTPAPPSITAGHSTRMFGAVGGEPASTATSYIIRSNQNSNYNGLQVTLEQRLTHHISAKRLLHLEQDAAEQHARRHRCGRTASSWTSTIPQLEYRQRSDQDRRHMMTMSFVWKPDYFDHSNRFVRTALNGWTVTRHLDGQQRSAIYRDHRQRQLLLAVRQQASQHRARQDSAHASTTAIRALRDGAVVRHVGLLPSRARCRLPGHRSSGSARQRRVPRSLTILDTGTSTLRSSATSTSTNSSLPASRRGLQRLQPRQPRRAHRLRSTAPPSARSPAAAAAQRIIQVGGRILF